MRVVAALRRDRADVLAILAAAAPLASAMLVAAALLAAVAGSALGADPTAAPETITNNPPTCAERYPAEGPAGVDLRLGCMIGELVGHYTGAAAEPATPASSYALLVVGILAAGVIAIWLAGRLIGGAAGRRLAPVQPGEWWLCPSCRSVNGAGVQHCYSCGAARPAGPAPTLTTDDAPSTTQSFGHTRKRG